MAQYRKIAKIALRSQPELLKALGITPPNGRATAIRKLQEDAKEYQPPVLAD